MRLPLPFASTLLLSFSALMMSALTACSGKQDTPAPTPTPTTPAPVAGKSHTITFNYVNRSLDAVKVGTPAATYNLGAGIRLYVDGKPLDLAGTLASGDTSYYVQPQTPASAIAFQKTFTTTGSTLKMELGFYNVVGTQAQPKTLSGQALSLSGTSLTLVPVIDGQMVTTTLVELVNKGTTAAPNYLYDNPHHPSRVVTLDLTKF